VRGDLPEGSVDIPPRDSADLSVAKHVQRVLAVLGIAPQVGVQLDGGRGVRSFVNRLIDL
jgi:hypothetical protein